MKCWYGQAWHIRCSSKLNVTVNQITLTFPWQPAGMSGPLCCLRYWETLLPQRLPISVILLYASETMRHKSLLPWGWHHKGLFSYPMLVRKGFPHPLWSHHNRKIPALGWKGFLTVSFNREIFQIMHGHDEVWWKGENAWMICGFKHTVSLSFSKSVGDHLSSCHDWVLPSPKLWSVSSWSSVLVRKQNEGSRADKNLYTNCQL